MFPHRYFAADWFTPRYFPPLARRRPILVVAVALQAEIPRPLLLQGSPMLPLSLTSSAMLSLTLQAVPPGKVRLENNAELPCLLAVPFVSFLEMRESAMPPEQTLRLIRAQDLSVRAALSPPADITGWSVTFTVRDSLGGTSVLAKTVGSGVTLSDPGQGVLSIFLAKADTSTLTVSSALAAGKGYVWDIKRTDTGSNLVLARGQLILEQEITA